MLGSRKPKRPLPRRRPVPKPAAPSLDLVTRLLYRDGLLLVVDKPAGLAVHAGPKGGATLEDYLDQLRFGLPARPQLAHRLDRDTSGCLALGRHPKALRRLGALFAEGKVEKTYWAVVLGGPAQDRGRIELPLAKLNAVRGWKMVAKPDGQAAVTEWEVLGRGPGLAWLACRPLTGRTHQIRVHLAELGCPILGDPLYGPKSQESRGQPLHLHARRLAIPLYQNKPPVVAEAPLPQALHKMFGACGWKHTAEQS
jgi:RluA family pseudouridine synthase